MPNAPRIRVLIVDDHPFLRAGIVATLQEEQDLLVVGEASTGREALEKFRECSPDVTLMDLQLPDLSGIDALLSIRCDYPDARVIMLTTFDGDALVRRALNAGAEGYILKDMIPGKLIASIRAVHAGRKGIPIEIVEKYVEHLRDADLSSREIEVLKAVSEGKSNKTVGMGLSISEETVKGHMKNILVKLRASDRTQAVCIAMRRGFLM